MFQFTQPKQAATYQLKGLDHILIVSIHAAQAGCDKFVERTIQPNARFNSRSPSGLRLAKGCRPYNRAYGFNSRSPSGLRLPFVFLLLVLQRVSIHAAQAGCDQRDPMGGRGTGVSIHAAQRAATRDYGFNVSLSLVSIHAAQAGCDIKSEYRIYHPLLFQFTQPKWAATYHKANT